MKKPIFENEEEAKTFFVDVFKSESGIAPEYFIKCAVSNAKDEGYIKQNPLEEATELFNLMKERPVNYTYSTSGFNRIFGRTVPEIGKLFFDAITYIVEINEKENKE